MEEVIKFCDCCGDRMWRYYFNIDGTSYCNRCMRSKFMVKIPGGGLAKNPEKEDSKTKDGK